jgi:hypothetical protein
VRRGWGLGKSVVWVLGLALFLLTPGPTWGQVLQVTGDNQQLYSRPDLASTPVAPLPRGAQVKVREQSGDWYRVDHEGKQGWVHRMAVRQAGPPPASLPGILGVGTPVRETKSDEVALAGKGFNPEVEAGYRQKHPEMKYGQVDEVEALQVDEARLGAFIQEGGLTP